tara:strand:- start:111 stop:797 length:687 start_codon:yes stop_codon:yes gene_type:complete
MQLRKSKKILIYFSLFIVLGSINNIELNKVKLDKIKNIQISGLDEKDNLSLLKDIKNLNLENIFFLGRKEVYPILASHSLIEKFDVIKLYPSTLLIEIKKTDFLARINKNGKILIIGSNGKLSDKKISNLELPFIFGKPKITEFLKFKKVVDKSEFSFNQIKNLYFFPSRRWDLELNGNILIKLPIDIEVKSLNIIYELINDKNFEYISLVDARIKNQIILNNGKPKT